MLASEIPIHRASLRVRSDSDGPELDGCMTVRERLATIKARVPVVQARIGMKRWNYIVNTQSVMERHNRNRRVINRAYHKMHEIAMSCVLPTVCTSLHLCEAPGGFVQCVSDHMRSPGGVWTWRAVTLQEGISIATDTLLPSDRGRFLLANVLRNEDTLVEELRTTFPDGVCLVTADGATNMNHERIEEEHLPLLLAQARIALRCLKGGGVFVIKVFECLHPCTRDLIAQLTHCFDTVSLIKPNASRPTNSERYVVCRSFVERTSIDDREYMHACAWRLEYEEIVCRQANIQIKSLERTLASVS